MADGTTTIEDVIDIFEGILGVVIGGRELSGIVEPDPELDDPEARRNYELQSVLAQTSEALIGPRGKDVVYVTTRKVWVVAQFHLALEYTTVGFQ